MRRFFIYLYVATAAAQLPIAYGVGHAIGTPWAWGLVVVVAALFVVLFHGRLALARWDRPISVWQRYLLEEPFFVHWCASLQGAVLAVVAMPVAYALGRHPAEGGLVAYLVALPFAFWGVVIRRRWVRVRELEIDVRGWPRAFDGYRVAQLSDLHVGSHCPRERVASWVRRVNAMEVDLVALTGDYVTSGVRFHEDIAASLGGLEARDGVFAVMGNHDYYGDGEPLMTLLRERGIALLRNEHVELERDGATIAVAGVDDVYTRRIDVAGTLAAIAEDRAILMLAHDPKSFADLAARCCLVLSGHTHWGQVGLPFFAERLNYATMAFRRAAGVHQLDGCTLYVSPGLGTTGPPVRLGTWPEISVITLRCAPTC